MNREKAVNNKITPHILIVEDEPTSLHFLRIILKNENLHFSYATNGAEAIEIIKKQEDISIVLMDLKMLGIDGFEATRKIKEIRPNLFVIAQTAFAFASDKQKAFDAGCVDYITKPIKKDLLLMKIRSHLK